MPAVQAKSLTKYYGKVRGISDVTFSVGEGEIFGFIGPNGAGKTTAIRTLLGLLHPGSGQAFIFGEPVVRGGGRLYHQVGYLPSEARYYPEMTGAELLEYSAGFYRGIDRRLISELSERLRFDPSRRIRAYSYGNRKKLGIIQALLHRPRLLVLDEPTSGLDPLIRLELFQILQELNHDGVTIFFSTHVLEEIDRLCSTVGVIKDGRLLRVSPVTEFPGRSMRVITIRPAGGVLPAGAGWDGFEQVEGKPGYYQLAVDAPANEVTARLAGMDLEYVSVTDPSIEDLFLAMYEPDGEGGGARDQS